jgi:hypothetical protein
MRILKLKLAYAEKYSDEFKLRERELRSEITRLRGEHTTTLRIEREKIEQQHRIKVATLEESKAKAIAEAQQLEFQLKVLSYQQNHDKQNSLLEQRLNFSMQSEKAASEAEHREAELRISMTAMQTKHDAELRAQKDQFTAEKMELVQKVQAVKRFILKTCQLSMSRLSELRAAAIPHAEPPVARRAPAPARAHRLPRRPNPPAPLRARERAFGRRRRRRRRRPARTRR